MLVPDDRMVPGARRAPRVASNFRSLWLPEVYVGAPSAMICLESKWGQP